MANKYWLAHLRDRGPASYLGMGMAQKKGPTLWVAGPLFRAYKEVRPLNAKELAQAFRRLKGQRVGVVVDGEDIRATFRQRGDL